MGTTVEGPYFDELRVGQVFGEAPGLTLTEGHAAVHQAVAGDRLRLPLDRALAAEVTGTAALAHPALIWDVTIGQSTVVTQHVKANLFYRGLAFRRFPLIGDTLRTRTEVVGLRQNRHRPDRRPTGLAALRIRTRDQHDRPVLDFWRCAMLPLRDPERRTGHADDLDDLGRDAAPADPEATRHWRLDRFRDRVPGPHLADLATGQRWTAGADVVSCAPELARLTLNTAAVHHDAGAAGGTRLVYGGHVIGLATAHLTRAIPAAVTVLGWHGCDHLGPVAEGDTLSSTVTAESVEPLPAGGGLLTVRVDTMAGEDRPVLRWTAVVLMA